MSKRKEEIDIFKALKKAIGDIKNVELSPVQGIPLSFMDIDKNELEKLKSFFQHNDDNGKTEIEKS